MAANGQAVKAGPWKPAIGDEKVKAATGRNWMGWFVILNRANAGAMRHREIATLLHEKYECPAWWSQMITVEYEHARGGRDKHQRPDGYSVSVTKVVPATLSKLFATATDRKLRAKWLPRGAFEETSKTKNKYWRGKWKKDARLEVGFYAKGEGKAQIALQVNRIPSADGVEKERTAWKKALMSLESLLAG